jgi:hypothetical protein
MPPIKNRQSEDCCTIFVNWDILEEVKELGGDAEQGKVANSFA